MSGTVWDRIRGLSGRTKTTIVVSIAVAIFIIVLVSNWMIDIPPGSVGIVNKKWGKSLGPDDVVAPDSSYAGVQADVLPTGWHFVNPITTDVRIVPAIEVPKGKVGIVNRKAGRKPKNPDDILVNEGERGYQREFLNAGTYFLNPHVVEVEIVDMIRVPASHLGVVTSKTGTPSTKDIVDPGERGVWREVLRPGDKYLNTKGYQVDIVPAVEVPAGHVGVVTSRTGERSEKDLVEKGERGVRRELLSVGTHYLNPKAETVEVVPAVRIDAGFVGVVVLRTGPPPSEANAVVVKKGERGVQPYVLPAGLHYLNPFEFTVTTVDSRVHKYEMTLTSRPGAGATPLDDRLEFPSADGFEIKVDTSIEWQIDTDKIPTVIATIGNTDEIIEKIIRPNAREIGRLEGSKLKAEDFIAGTEREKFVANFSSTLKARCGEKGIIVHKALVREVIPPEEVARPLKDREVALLMRSTNEEKQRQAQSEAQLAEEQAKIEQKKLLISADTEKKVAEMQAEREKEVARIGAEKMREVAKVEKEQQAMILEKQKLEAQGIRELADAEAHRARAVVQADGALDKKLRAWTEVMSKWAENANLVPRVVVGGGGGGVGADGKSAITGQELILSLMAIERLERFMGSSVPGEGEGGPGGARPADSSRPPAPASPAVPARPAGTGSR